MVRMVFVLLLLTTVHCRLVQAADLAANLCQDEYKVTDETMCQGLLIGTIDSLHGLGEYCPDGATSYGYIISTWRRLLKKEPELKDQPTIKTMRKAIAELSLLCGN
jgi:uncharacterized cysteine cluster protein YcgN (CxxCxxCC family)